MNGEERVTSPSLPIFDPPEASAGSADVAFEGAGALARRGRCPCHTDPPATSRRALMIGQTRPSARKAREAEYSIRASLTAL